LRCPTQSTPGKANYADDDQQDADNSGRLHRFDVIMRGVLKAVG
jgi:hypothetical protein